MLQKNDNYDCCCGIFQVPGMESVMFYTLSYLNLVFTSLQGRNYFHFMGEATEDQEKLSNLPKATKDSKAEPGFESLL